jgi:hypothetical protein
MDINKQIQLASDKIIEEQLPTMVEKATIKMLESVVQDMFSSYSPMAKSIKEKLEAGLDINLQRFDTIDYNAIVANAINENIVQQVNLEPILKLTQNAIGFINKKEIDLSEIVEMVKTEAMEDSSEQGGEISVHIKENTEYKWVEISLDTEGDLDEEQCGLMFIFSLKEGSGTIFSFRQRDRYYDTKQKDISPARLTALSILEHKIFRLYSAQVKINFDSDNFDTEWFKYEY